MLDLEWVDFPRLPLPPRQDNKGNHEWNEIREQGCVVGRTVPVSRLGLRTPDCWSTQAHVGARRGCLARSAIRDKVAEFGPSERLRVVVTSGDEEMKAAGIVSLFQAPGSPGRQVWSPLIPPKES